MSSQQFSTKDWTQNFEHYHARAGSGSEHFQAKLYKTSIRLFEASMLYLVRDGEGCMLEAKSLRILCLCYMALSQFERAAEVIERAEEVENLIWKPISESV